MRKKAEDRLVARVLAQVERRIDDFYAERIRDDVLAHLHSCEECSHSRVDHCEACGCLVSDCSCGGFKGAPYPTNRST